MTEAIHTSKSTLLVVKDWRTAKPFAVPTADCQVCKIEFKLHYDPQRGGKKFNIYIGHFDPHGNLEPAEDRRGGNVRHNHPWRRLRLNIHKGGYEDNRIFMRKDGALVYQQSELQEGMSQDVPFNHFHNIRNIQPGTVTEMILGPLVQTGPWGFRKNGWWGYMDETGRWYENNESPYDDPQFSDDRKTMLEQYSHLIPQNAEEFIQLAMDYGVDIRPHLAEYDR